MRGKRCFPSVLNIRETILIMNYANNNRPSDVGAPTCNIDNTRLFTVSRKIITELEETRDVAAQRMRRLYTCSAILRGGVAFP